MMRIVRDAAQPHVRLSEVFPTCVWRQGDSFMVAEFGVIVPDAVTMTTVQFATYLRGHGWTEYGLLEVYKAIDEVTPYWDGDLWVCTDCYIAHHYGAFRIRPEDADEYNKAGWYAGDSDVPCDREPLGECRHLELADNTCSNHYHGQSCETNEDGENVEPCDHCGRSDDENGIREFDWWTCQGCGSHLGGSRYRLAYKRRETAHAEPSD